MVERCKSAAGLPGKTTRAVLNVARRAAAIAAPCRPSGVGHRQLHSRSSRNAKLPCRERPSRSRACPVSRSALPSALAICRAGAEAWHGHLQHGKPGGGSGRRRWERQHGVTAGAPCRGSCRQVRCGPRLAGWAGCCRRGARERASVCKRSARGPMRACGESAAENTRPRPPRRLAGRKLCAAGLLPTPPPLITSPENWAGLREAAAARVCLKGNMAGAAPLAASGSWRRRSWCAHCLYPSCL